MNNRFEYIENAFLYPATNDWKGGLYTHGVDTNDAINIPIGQFKFGRSLIDHEKRKLLRETVLPKKINGTYLYLGAASSHFGHFFSECISRFWALEPELNLQIDGVVVLPSSGENCKKYIELTLELLGLNHKDILYIDEFTKVDLLIIPEQGCITGNKPKEFYIDFLKKRSNPDLFKNKNLPEKIFVSRRYFKNHGRVAGMDYVAETLQNQGYFEFLPEKYSIPKQIEFICSAQEIVWEEGSAVHLLELLPYIKSRQTLIMRRELTNFDYIKFILEHKSASVMTYSNVSFIDCVAPPHNKMSKFNNIEEFSKFIELQTGASIDIEKLKYESMLDEIDFTLFEAKNKISEDGETLKKISTITARDLYRHKKAKIKRPNIGSCLGPAPIVAWCIDFPPKGVSETLAYKNIEIRGWFVLDDDFRSSQLNYSLKIVSQSGKLYEISLDISRPDVIKAILGNTDIANKSDKCGFYESVEYDLKYHIYLCNETESVLLSTIEISH